MDCVKLLIAQLKQSDIKFSVVLTRTQAKDEFTEFLVYVVKHSDKLQAMEIIDKLFNVNSETRVGIEKQIIISFNIPF